MDWARTKTFFILAFTVVNIFFAAQLWIIPVYNSTPRNLTAQQIEARIQELRFRGIQVTAEVPRVLRPQRMMEFQSNFIRYNQAADQLLGPGWKAGETEGTYTLGDVLLTLTSQGVLHYHNPLRPGGAGQDLGEARRAVEAFLEDSLGLPEDARLVITRDLGGEIYLEYRQFLRRQQLSVSFIRLWVVRNEVTRMEWYWAEPLGRLSTDLSIIPATGALLIAADHLLPPAIVTNIYISWYSEPLSAARWRVPCVWVVETKQVRLYINAFTGELEYREDIPAGEWPSDVE